MKYRNRRKRKPIRNAVNPLRFDPTRTTTLRRLFAAEIKKRFRRLRFRIHQYVSKMGEPAANAFCPTGAGGGQDNSCSPNRGGMADSISLPGVSEGEKAALLSALDKALTLGNHKLKVKAIVVSEMTGKDQHHNAHFDPNSRTLHISPTFFEWAREWPSKREETLAEYRRDGGERNYAREEAETPEEAIALLAAHEAGHAVEIAGLLDLQKASRVAGNPNEKELLTLSGYSTMNLRERFAEAHAFATVGKLDKVHPAVKSWYEAAIATADPEPLPNYIRNAFCPTGAGGGLDNSCPPGGKEAAEKSIKDAPNESFHGDPDNKYGTYIKVPFEVDETKSGAALAEKLQDLKPVEASVHVSSLIATQPLVQREALQWMLKKGLEQVDRGEGPAVVRVGGKHYLADGNHRSAVAKFEGRDTLKVRLYDLDKAGVTVNAPDWRAMRDPEKVKAFQVWLQQQVDSEVLKDADRLFEKYAQQGFKKGAGRAFDDVKQKRWGKGEGAFYDGSRDQFLKDTFAQPVAIDKIKLLAGRSYDDLEGVTEAMSTKMSRSLTDGLVQGKSPRDIADDLVDDVDGIGEARALTIARTEIIRAHADGQLEALDKLGVEEVGVAIEWSTTGDEKVCPKCRPMEGVVLTLDEAAGLIPRHPNCRCAWIPVVQEEPGQKNTKLLIEAAIDASLAEGGEGDPWPGADVDVDEKRPKSILDNEFTEYLMNAFCPTGPGGGVDPSCSPGEGGGAKGEEPFDVLDWYSGTDQTTGGHKEVNAYLRGVKSKDPQAVPTEVSEQAKKVIRELDKVFAESATVLDAPRTVYRGSYGNLIKELGGVPEDYGDEWHTYPNPEMDLSKLKGKVVEDKGYLSTSTDIQEAKKFNEQVILKITAPKGTKVIDYGFRYGEKENLFNRGTKFKITGVKKKVDSEGYWKAEISATIVDNEVATNAYCPTDNVFCPTGPGGGVDATCSPGEVGAGKKAEKVYDKPAFFNPTTEEWAQQADLYGTTKTAEYEKAEYKRAMEAEDKRLNGVRNRVTAVKARVELAKANWNKQISKLNDMQQQYEDIDNDIDQLKPYGETAELKGLREQRAKLGDEIDKHADKCDEAKAKFRAQADAATAKAHSEIREAMKEVYPPPMKNVRFPRGEGTDPKTQHNLIPAEDFLSGMVSERHKSRIEATRAETIPASDNQRAHYRGRASLDVDTNTQSAVRLGYREDAGTIVHEYGHAIEDTATGGTLARGFLLSRVGKEPAKGMGPNYDVHEVGRDDEFGKASNNPRYVGKFYKSGHTEILSMGMEMVHNDPVGFASKDPEYFKFVIGMMDGSLYK